MIERSQRREIDLAGRPVARVTWLLRLIVRLGQITFWLTVAGFALPWFWISRRSFATGFGAALTFLFQRLGATFIKIGQIMSARPDLVSPAFNVPLTALQDRVPPFDGVTARRILETDFGRKLEEMFEEFDPVPVASGSVAQVHRAVLHHSELPQTFPSRVVAIKVRRPGIVRRAYLDEAILRAVARLLSWIPTLWILSPLEAVELFCAEVNKQLDFRIEAENNRRFRRDFEDEPQVLFPALVETLCNDRVLTMEFVEGDKLDRFHARSKDPILVVRKLLEVACRMCFERGFQHADLHPGNILFLPGDRVAMLDVGLVGVLDEDARRRFALIHHHMFSGKTKETARWLLESAHGSVADPEQFEREVSELVGSIHDQPAALLRVGGTLVDLLAVLRRHRLRFEATFTVAILSIMAVEGIARRLAPQMNVSRELLPHVESALARGIVGAKVSASDAALPTAFGAGRYRVRRLLGEGARKRVYLARDRRLDRDVAIAVMRARELDDAARARLLEEARAVARLAEHPRIVPVYDSGEEDGVPYVVSQAMAGGTLSSRLVRASDHRLALEEAARFADQILQALEHAHANGVIHGDVKPENVWLTEDGYAKLGDFGLARMVAEVEGDGRWAVGTALYMSPEQVVGRAVDTRSDLYSVGVTAYELLTGRPPFEGESVGEVVGRHVEAVPDPPSSRVLGLPPTVDGFVLRLLAKDPDARFAGAAEARAALRDVVAGVASPAVPISVASSSTTTAFVGREHEMARLRKGLDEALAGHGRMITLVGEPGIGKTRASELLASYARQRGALVLAGRAFEGEGAPAFWPWVQVLRSYLEAHGTLVDLGLQDAYVARLVPELREVRPELAGSPPVEGEEARFRLFDAVTAFLRRAATAQPLVLLLDDLHWADKPSLLLLHFLAREISGARILVVGAYRDVEIQHGHPLADVLPLLRRERLFERLLLRGLSEGDVRALVDALTGATAPRAFVRAIYRETEGNPFFIEETLRHLSEEGLVSSANGRWASRVSPEEMGLPEGIREVIGRRLSRLGRECRTILSTASVLGRDFDGAILERVVSLEPAHFRELLDEACRSSLVEADAAGGRHRFSHALVRETLYAEIGAADRVRLHARIADALYAAYGQADDDRISELAHHFLEASPAGGAERAIEFASRAAEHAERRFAYEEVAGFHRRAIRVLEAEATPDDGRRCELLVDLGTAEWRSGDFETAKDTVRRASDLAQTIGRYDLLARAAIVYSGEELQTLFAAIDQDMVPTLEQAMATLPTDDGALRAMVMGRLGGALFYTDQEARRSVLFEQAIAMAERLGDRRALASVLMNKMLARWGAMPLPALADDAATFLSIAEELRDERLQLIGCGLRGILRGETGDLIGADECFAQADKLAERHPHLRWFVHYTRNSFALVRAKPAAAEELMRRANEVGIAGDSLVTLLIFSMQKAMTRWQQGDFDEAERTMGPLLEAIPRSLERSVVRFVRVTFWSIMGVEKHVEELVGSTRDLSQIPRDTFWLTQLALFGMVVAGAGEADRAAEIYQTLLPYDGRAVSPGGAYCMGSLARYLGLLARTFGRHDDAVRHFEEAILFEREMPLWRSRSRHELARTLLERGAAGDRDRALVLLGEAAEEAHAYGLKQVLADAVALRLEVEGIASASASSSIDRVASSVEARGAVDLRRSTAPNGTVTLLFTDIERFAEITEGLGDLEAHRLMRAHHAIIRDALAAHGGSEIEEQSDGFLLAFPTAAGGLRYAVEVQRRFAEHRLANAEDPLHVRMGLHTGEPIREGERFFGKTVILTARIGARARGDEILVSSLVHGLTEPTDEFTFDAEESVALPGLAGEHRIFTVAWEGAGAPRRVRSATPAVAPAAAANVFRLEGDFWTISYAGQSIRMKDAKGLQYLAALIRRSGEDVHVNDLVNGSSPGAVVPGAGELGIAGDLGDAGEVLDLKARAQYRERVESLRAELDEAEAGNDIGRSEALREEIDFIGRELSSAFGLGGRSRRAAAPTERARKAVSSRVSDSITRIRKQSADLGAHFTNSIRLGVFCSYQPEKPTPWTL